MCCVIKGRISFGEVVVHHPLPQLSYTLSGRRQMIFVRLDDAYQRGEAQICISITQNLKNPPTLLLCGFEAYRYFCSTVTLALVDTETL